MFAGSSCEPGPPSNSRLEDQNSAIPAPEANRIQPLLWPAAECSTCYILARLSPLPILRGQGQTRHSGGSRDDSRNGGEEVETAGTSAARGISLRILPLLPYRQKVPVMIAVITPYLQARSASHPWKETGPWRSNYEVPTHCRLADRNATRRNPILPRYVAGG